MAARDGAGAAGGGSKRHHAAGGDRTGAERGATASAANRTIEITFADGARVCVRGEVSAETLRQVSSCCDDRLAGGHAGVVGGRRHRHAQGVRQPGAQAQTVLGQDPFSGHVFCFRGRRGDLVKLLWWDGDGLCLFAKRLERGRFVWPRAEAGVAVLTRAQLSMLLEGIDWRCHGGPGGRSWPAEGW